MKNLNTERNAFNMIIGVLGTALAYLFGEWDMVLQILLIMMAIDYATGMIAGAINKELNSSIGLKGLLRKSSILLVLIVATLLDRLLNQNTWTFRTFTCFFYIANEALSILENVGKAGVQLPTGLISALEQLKKKGDQNGRQDIDNKRTDK